MALSQESTAWHYAAGDHKGRPYAFLANVCVGATFMVARPVWAHPPKITWKLTIYICKAAISGGRGVWLLDIFPGTVVQDPNAHFLPCRQGKFADRHVVYLGAKALIRLQTKTVPGPGSFFMPVFILLFHPVTPKASMPGKKKRMGGSF